LNPPSCADGLLGPPCCGPTLERWTQARLATPTESGCNRERRRTVPDVRSVFLDTEGRAVVSPDREEFSCLANCCTKGDWLQWDAVAREPGHRNRHDWTVGWTTKGRSHSWELLQRSVESLENKRVEFPGRVKVMRGGLGRDRALTATIPHHGSCKNLIPCVGGRGPQYWPSGFASCCERSIIYRSGKSF